MSLFASLGIIAGNVGGALAASVLPASIGGGAAGAGGLSSLIGATTAGTAGSALAGTALAPAASTAALGNLAAAGAAPTATAPTAVAAPTVSTAAPTVSTSAPTMGQMAAEVGLTSPSGMPAAGAVNASPGVGITPSGVTAPVSGQVGQGAGMSTAPLSTPAGTAAPTLSESAALTAATTGGSKGLEAIQQAEAIGAQNKAYNKNRAARAEEVADTKSKVEGTLAGGKGLGAAHGGRLELESGQFVIPADIVADLGNGDTRSGMKFLHDFFMEG